MEACTCMLVISLTVPNAPATQSWQEIPGTRVRVSFGLWILEVNGPTQNLHILNPELVLITAWGTTIVNQWEYYVLFSDRLQHSTWAKNNKIIIFPLIRKNAAPNSHWDHLSIQNIQVLVGTLMFQLSPLRPPAHPFEAILLYGRNRFKRHVILCFRLL